MKGAMTMTSTRVSPFPAARMVSLSFVGLSLAVWLSGAPALAQHRKAPPGMFRDLDDEIVGKAVVIHGKQLFIDDHIIEDIKGAKKVLNRPVKHPRNPLIRQDKSWEHSITYGAVVHDERDGLYKMWYQIWTDDKNPVGTIGYATSRDGIAWEKPVTDKRAGTNLVRFAPKEPWVGGPGVLIDATEKDRQRRFKMLYLAQPTLKAGSLSSCVAYSADGIH